MTVVANDSRPGQPPAESVAGTFLLIDPPGAAYQRGRFSQRRNDSARSVECSTIGAG